MSEEWGASLYALRQEGVCGVGIVIRGYLGVVFLPIVVFGEDRIFAGLAGFGLGLMVAFHVILQPPVWTNSINSGDKEVACATNQPTFGGTHLIMLPYV